MAAHEMGRHSILHLWFLSFFFLSPFFFSSPNLSGRRLDVYHTSTDHVALSLKILMIDDEWCNNTSNLLQH